MTMTGRQERIEGCIFGIFEALLTPMESKFKGERATKKLHLENSLVLSQQLDNFVAYLDFFSCFFCFPVT